MTWDVYAVYLELRSKRRLDTNWVFLYKGKPSEKPRTGFAAACRRVGIRDLRLHDFRHTATMNLKQVGVDTMEAMKVVGHKSEQMHRCYHSIKPADLHQSVAILEKSAANTVITPDVKRASGPSVSH